MNKDFTLKSREISFSKQFVKVLKWLILIAAYVYLGYVLIQFDNYDQLWSYFSHITPGNLLKMAFVLALLPINLLLETYKWKFLVSGTELISMHTAFRAVLAGFSTGFITPNRSGEFAGRVLYLKSGNRNAGVFYSVLNSLTQNLVLTLAGLPSAFYFFLFINNDSSLHPGYYLIMVTIGVIISVVLYFSIPFFTKMKFRKRFTSFIDGIKTFSFRDLFRILSVSLLRYIVFCTQFYAMLLFFGIDIELWQALIAIPASYLFVTFTPSLALSEAAIRTSYAVIFIGAFSTQLAGIAFAGASLWFINFGLPMLFGAHFIVQKN